MKKPKHKKNKIVFDEEIVTKGSNTAFESTNINEVPSKSEVDSDKALQSQSSAIVKKNKRKKERKNPTNNISEEDKNRKEKIDNKELDVNELLDDDTHESEDATDLEKASNLNTQKEESIRARKRRKHMELLQAKKLHSELNLQQKCLNYLSMWKHSRSQWKFEKLKQVWLQQNMFDDVKVPDEFWDTLVEYFSNAKGRVKTNILNEAIKYVDSVQTEEGESLEKKDTKYLRARSIVQTLQD